MIWNAGLATALEATEFVHSPFQSSVESTEEAMALRLDRRTMAQEARLVTFRKWEAGLDAGTRYASDHGGVRVANIVIGCAKQLYVLVKPA